MSQLASATRIAGADLPALVEAAIPRRSLFGRGSDNYAKFLRERGRELPTFDSDGTYLVTALVYLQERGIDLLDAHKVVATRVTEAQGTTHIIFTPEQGGLLEQLTGVNLGSESLRAYYEEFNGVEDPMAGEAMLAGLSYVRDTIRALGTAEVAVLAIG